MCFLCAENFLNYSRCATTVGQTNHENIENVHRVVIFGALRNNTSARPKRSDIFVDAGVYRAPISRRYLTIYSRRANGESRSLARSRVRARQNEQRGRAFIFRINVSLGRTCVDASWRKRGKRAYIDVDVVCVHTTGRNV